MHGSVLAQTMTAQRCKDSDMRRVNIEGVDDSSDDDSRHCVNIEDVLEFVDDDCRRANNDIENYIPDGAAVVHGQTARIDEAGGHC